MPNRSENRLVTGLAELLDPDGLHPELLQLADYPHVGPTWGSP
jgi:hypothetical protein